MTDLEKAKQAMRKLSAEDKQLLLNAINAELRMYWGIPQ